MGLDDRCQQILQAVVSCHIGMGEPVGSRTLARKYNFRLSPATIRNIMADLEELGYLQHPHTSAGRVPTEKGYRFYVEHLSKMPRQIDKPLAGIEECYRQDFAEITHLLRHTSKILSSTTHYIGVVLAPRLEDMMFKHISFVHLRDNTVLVIFVSCSGLVQQKIIEVSEVYNQNKLDQMANFLNEHCRNIPMYQIRKRLLDMMEQDKRLYDRLYEQALELSQELFDLSEKAKIYIDGQLNVLGQPEFGNMENMKAILGAFEEKGQLIVILDKCLEDGGLQILIGSENQIEEMRDCSFVTTTYNIGDSAIGTLGVIGPTRMEYSSIIPLVEYIAHMVSQRLSKKLSR